MTVTSEVARDDYIGNGATAAFLWTFPVFETSELSVYGEDADGYDDLLTEGVDYTAAVNTSGTGTITLTAGNLADGKRLSIQRGVPYTQPTDLTQSSKYSPATMQRTVDRLCQEIIRLKGEFDRCLKVPHLEAGGDDATKLPSAVNRADRQLSFDEDGNATVSGTALLEGITVTAYAESLLDDASASAARTTLGFPTALDDMTVLADGSTTRRDLSARFVESIHVKDHGAVGDGSTDDTTAIQAALTAAAVAGAGKRVVLTDGATYLISAVLTISSGVTLTGRATIRAGNSANIATAMVYGNGVSNAVVEGLEFDGNKANTGSNYGVRFEAGTNNRISGCYIHDTIQAGIYLASENSSRINSNRVLNCGQAGPTDNHGIMVISITATALRNIVITDNVVDGSYRKNITVYSAAPGTVDGVVISNNASLSGGLGGIYIANAAATTDQRNVTITGNVCKDCYTGIEVANLTGGVVANNTVRTSGSSGMEVTDCTAVTVSANHIEDSQVRGIFVRGSASTSTAIVIAGNDVRRSNRSGAGFGPGIGLAGATYCNVIGNRVSDSASAMTHGIYEESPGNNNQIHSNVVTDFTTSAVVVTGAATRFAHGTGLNHGFGLTDPNNTVDIGGGVSFRPQTFALVNGANNNVALPTKAGALVVTAPTAIFNLSGISGGVNGQVITIVNYTNFTMTVNHNSGASSVGNKILIGGSADITVSTYGSVHLQWYTTTNSWIVMAHKA